MQITTDAGRIGWGTHGNRLHFHALWSPSEKLLHVNHLELLAIFKAPHAFELLVTGTAVQITTDNTMALFYLNKQGRTHSFPLLWEWCLKCHLFPIAVCISTHHNRLVDSQTQFTDAQMVPQRLHLSSSMGTTTHLRTNRKHKMSPLLLQSRDRPRLHWRCSDDTMDVRSDLPLPSDPSIPKDYHKAPPGTVQCILIAPCWPRQPWFTMLRSISVDFLRLPPIPYLLPQNQDLIALHLTA